MSDPIDSVRRSNAANVTKAVGAARAPGPVKRDNEETPLFEDLVDIAPAEHLQSTHEEIDLSLQMIRALARGELPPEAVEALSSFAALGDLKNALLHCDRVESKSLDYISWPNTKTLAQALEFAAS